MSNLGDPAYVCWSGARCGEESCTVRFEEGLDDECRGAIDCFANLYESSSYHFVNTAGCTGHPGRRRTSHNRLLLYIGRRGSGHDRRPISFGRCRDGNRRHGADGQVTMVTRYHYYGRTDASPAVSMCF